MHEKCMSHNIELVDKISSCPSPRWEQLGDSETVTEVAEEPTREEKLEAYLQIAAAGAAHGRFRVEIHGK